MSRPSRFLLAAAAVVALLAAGAASAQRFYDPPGRVARISDMRGYLSYSPAGDGEWYDAHRNRPIVRGDALWSDRGARAELQAGSTWIRIDQETSLEFLELNDRMLQVEVAEGSVNVRVRRLYPGQRVEVDTPNLAFVIDRPGNFRLDVDREGDNTTIEARQGGGRVYGVGGRFDVRGGDVVVFYGEDVRDYEMYAFPGMDSFDRYARQRDQRIDRSLSLRYLGDDLVGYSDLDDYGRWSRYPQYGNVWFPSNTYAGWAPYQDGQWVWQDPWGWTWVDDEPWGFAPSHYGRWAWIDGRWGWVPGPRSYRPVYAPALVAFLELAGGSIGWFPLGPQDVYYPTYNVSSNYFRAVNIANTTVSTATVNNSYNSFARVASVPLVQGAYRNRTVPTAITAVPQDVFVNSKPVRQARREARELAAATAPGAKAPELRRNLSVRPDRASIRGAAAAARVRPPRAVEDEQVIVHNAPPAAAPTPAATSTPAPAAPARERPRRVRQVTEQQAATDARARGPRHEGASAAAATAPAEPVAATPAAATAPGGGRLRALDREALPRTRGGRRSQEREQRGEPAAPAAATPAATTPAAPAPAAQPAAPATPPPAPAGQSQQAREAEQARAAQQKAREEQRQAMEAQRKAQQERRESEQALREAQEQQAQAQADATAKQQREAADAEARAVEERRQAREAQQEAQRQQREAQRAQQEAAAQAADAKAKSDAAAANAPPAAPPPARERNGQRPDCLPQERIDAMRKRGVPEERLAEVKACPVAEAQQQ